MHAPPEHTSPGSHTLPQLLQFIGSLNVSTQAPLHSVVPLAQFTAHAEFEQTCPLGHGIAQPPQLLESIVVLTQAVPHFVVPPEH
jgi:hypothetical protein